MIRPPKPFLYRQPHPDRLPKRKLVTLCAAGINNKKVIIVFDSKLSFYGGTFSADRMAFKMRGSGHAEWAVLFSGENSHLVPMLEAIKEAGRRLQKNTLRNASRIWSKAYRSERQRIIETEVLSKHDIGSYDEYLKLKKTEPQFFEAVTQEIEKVEQDWNLLFCGFDGEGEPHVFVIAEHGKIQYCDIEGFAVIGSGTWPAIVSLTSMQYSSNMPYGRAIYSLLAAKFAAETAAEGVGEDTLFAILDYDKELSPILFSNEQISEARAMWKGMPRFPQGIEEHLGEQAGAIEREFKKASDLRASTSHRAPSLADSSQSQKP